MKASGWTVMAGGMLALFALGVLVTLVVLAERQGRGDRANADPLLWDAVQVEHALAGLHDRLRSPARTGDVAALRTGARRLLDRLDDLASGETGRQLRAFDLEPGPIGALWAQAEALVAALSDERRLAGDRRDWAQRLGAFRERLRELTIRINRATTANRRAQSAVTDALQLGLVASFLGVLAAAGLLLWLQGRASREAEHARSAYAIANAQLHDAIETIPSGFVLFDESDRFILCNRRYKLLYPGIVDLMQPGTRFEVLARAAAERGLLAIEPNQVEQWMARRLAVRAETDGVTEQELADGRWVLAFDRRSGQGWTVGVRTEITDLKIQEASLARALAAAETASRSKSDFLAMMSHEIRTPMNGVLGTLELLGGTGLNREQRYLLEVSEQSARNLLVILDDLLDLSKMEAGRLDLETVAFAVRPLVRSVADIFRAKAAQKGIDLSATIPDDTPERLIGDPGRLRQILLNLVGNAVKFTERGFVDIRVLVLEPGAAGDGAGMDRRPGTGPAFESPNGRARSGDDRDRREPDPREPADPVPAATGPGAGRPVRVRFEVEDTGPGISDEKAADLFREFTQLDNSYSRTFGGTGLGLAICRKLGELLGGEVGVIGETGVGSIFWFEAPFHPAPEDADAGRRDKDSGPAAGAPEGGPWPVTEQSARDADRDADRDGRIGDGADFGVGLLRPPRVLVVDDSETNRLIARELLIRESFVVVAATDGIDAIFKAQLEPFDVILMDISMPRLDGFEATRMIRQLDHPNARTPIVAMTAHTGPQDREHCAAAGMSGLLAKPLNGATLIQSVRNALQGRDTLAHPVEDGPAPHPIRSDAAVGDAADEGAARPPLLNRAEIAAMVADTSADVMQAVLGRFLMEMPERLTGIEQGLAERRFDDVARHAHSLKGSAGSFGCLRLQQAADAVEAASESADPAAVRARADRLAQVAAETVPVVQEMIDASVERGGIPPGH